MKKILTLLVVFFAVGSLQFYGQNVAVNDDGSAPDASAMLDVKSTTRGFLPPRVALTTTSSASPITSPADGLFVYDTASVSDVTPGYYYWLTSQWVRFTTGAIPFNVVIKSADATLLKTENMVLASGTSTTLTLPAVTAGTDDGVTITVKNTGAVTDLISVQAQSGKTIDGVASAPATLTRWKSRTFVASGGNWFVKDKEYRVDNVLDVSAKGSFTTLPEVFSFLGSHAPTEPITIRLGGGTYTVSSTITINLAKPVTIQGASFGESTIAVTGASPAFNCQSQCFFKFIIFDGTGSTSNDGLVLSGSNRYYEVKDCEFDGFKRQIALTGTSASLWAFENDFNDASGTGAAGIEVAGGTSLKVSECDFTNCLKGINLVSGTGDTVSILNCTFYNTGTQTGIVYVSATFSTFTSMFITNNAWNNVGTFISGFVFDGTESPVGRDSKAFIQQNAGMEDKNPHVKINLIDNLTTTTLTNTGTWYKVNYTNTSSATCKWTVANNKISYQPVNARDVIMHIAGNVRCNNNNTATITLGIVRKGATGTVYGPVTVRTSSNTGYFAFGTNVYIEDVTSAITSDYFELYASTTNGGDVIIVSDLNWYTDSK
ncbi:MAG: hypothetical protein NTW10_10605 [Bacteroidetes bacterium]|nr:hypothetical protein [Bacteroidota bacterium]